MNSRAICVIQPCSICGQSPCENPAACRQEARVECEPFEFSTLECLCQGDPELDDEPESD